MKENNSRKKQLIFFRFWAGQLPLIVLFVLYMMREVISLQILWCVTIGMCMSTSFVVNHYFMKEVRKQGEYTVWEPTLYLQQLGFIVLFSIIGLVSLHRGLTAEYFYQKIIGFIGFIIAITFLILLCWGIRAMKDWKKNK
ncbi:hypothetical protein [Streptococcus suis]|uniref:hypothetical protein n=1 Tax=Streptococcus suis TaxID=1307 RepID=UPI000C1879A2|nr:hypothetical protein [Streptococcus suis]